MDCRTLSRHDARPIYLACQMEGAAQQQQLFGEGRRAGGRVCDGGEGAGRRELGVGRLVLGRGEGGGQRRGSIGNGMWICRLEGVRQHWIGSISYLHQSSVAGRWSSCSASRERPQACRCRDVVTERPPPLHIVWRFENDRGHAAVGSNPGAPAFRPVPRLLSCPSRSTDLRQQRTGPEGGTPMSMSCSEGARDCRGGGRG